MQSDRSRSLDTADLARRDFLRGMAGILAAAAAPAIILTPGLLMPVRKLWTPATVSIRGSIGVAGRIILTGVWVNDQRINFDEPVDLPNGERIVVYTHPHGGIAITRS